MVSMDGNFFNKLRAHDAWHMAQDTWHMTQDTWHMKLVDGLACFDVFLMFFYNLFRQLLLVAVFNDIFTCVQAVGDEWVVKN